VPRAPLRWRRDALDGYTVGEVPPDQAGQLFGKIGAPRGIDPLHIPAYRSLARMSREERGDGHGHRWTGHRPDCVGAG
jgi:hypothetical protein